MAHRRYMSYTDPKGWRCQFLEADLKTPLSISVKMRVKRANHEWGFSAVCGTSFNATKGGQRNLGGYNYFIAAFTLRV